MTDEYVPRTQDVKNCYVFAGAGPDGSTVKPARVLRHEFDRWLEAHDREVAAKAWDEGCDACEEFVDGPDWAPAPTNPYRADGDAVT